MKERNNIKISLIIPVFNIEKYVYKCLCSVVEQTKMPDEVIIIDDCSQEKTSIICDEFSKKYSFIKTIHLTQNGGVSKARNVGIEVSNGKYLLFIDGDDILSKYYVEKILDNIEKFKADLLIGNYTTAENYLDQFENCCIKNNINNMKAEEFRTKLALGEKEGYLWNKLFKRNIIIDNQLKFDERLELFEDLKFVYQYVMNSDTVIEIPDVIYWYRTRIDSAVHQLYSGKRWQQYCVIKYILNNEKQDSKELNNLLIFYAWMYLNSSVNLNENDRKKIVLKDIKKIFFKTNIPYNIKQLMKIAYKTLKNR